MNLLTPIVLLLLTLFFVAAPARVDVTRQTAATAPVMEQAAVANPAAATIVHEAPGTRAATQQSVLPEPVPVFPIELGEVSVSGSEAEADAIESSGVLNRLELFEF